MQIEKIISDTGHLTAVMVKDNNRIVNLYFSDKLIPQDGSEVIIPFVISQMELYESSELEVDIVVKKMKP